MRELLEVIKKEYLEEGHSVPKISKRLKISEDQIYDLMRKHDIPRRTYSESNYFLHNDRNFKLKGSLTAEEKALKIAGVMLYWAEGSKKSLESSTVDFTNSDPQMVELFMTFLRKICGVHEARIRIYLYAFKDQDTARLKEFWSSVTKIPFTQFTRPYVRQGNANKSGRKMPHGVIHVRYADKRLLLLLLKWIDEIQCSLNGQVPKWSTGPDCDKQRSVVMPGGKVGEFREP